ncbi:hypothetical protein OIU76_023508 [Salix suchowensis]|nr:hypothetical protein OIU76_023508 [Salix suchowensis]
MGWLPQTLACFSAVQTYQLPSEVHLSLQQLSWCRNKPPKTNADKPPATTRFLVLGARLLNPAIV